MILGLDISTSITGVTIIDDDGEILLCEAIDTRNKNHYKDLFDKANHIRLELLKIGCYHKIKKIYIEHAKIPKSKLNQILKHDLWFDAKTCLNYGLVDEII